MGTSLPPSDQFDKQLATSPLGQPATSDEPPDVTSPKKPDIRGLISDPRFRSLSGERKRAVLEHAGADSGFIDKLLGMQVGNAGTQPKPTTPVGPTIGPATSPLTPERTPAEALERITGALGINDLLNRLMPGPKVAPGMEHPSPTPTAAEEPIGDPDYAAMVRGAAHVAAVPMLASPLAAGVSIPAIAGTLAAGLPITTALGKVAAPLGREIGSHLGLPETGAEVATQASTMLPLGGISKLLRMGRANAIAPKVDATPGLAEGPFEVPAVGGPEPTSPVTPSIAPKAEAAASPISGDLKAVVEQAKTLGPEAEKIAYELIGRKIGSALGVPGAIFIGGRIGRWLYKAVSVEGSPIKTLVGRLFGSSSGVPESVPAQGGEAPVDESLVSAVMKQIPGTDRARALEIIKASIVSPVSALKAKSTPAPVPRPSALVSAPTSAIPPEVAAETAARDAARASLRGYTGRIGEIPPPPEAPLLGRGRRRITPSTSTAKAAVPPTPPESATESTTTSEPTTVPPVSGSVSGPATQSKPSAIAPKAEGKTRTQIVEASRGKPPIPFPDATPAETASQAIGFAADKLRGIEKGETGDAARIVASIRKHLKVPGAAAETEAMMMADSSDARALARAAGFPTAKGPIDVRGVLDSLKVPEAKLASQSASKVTGLTEGFTLNRSPKSTTFGLSGPKGEKVGGRILADRIEMVSIGKGQAPDSRSAMQALRDLAKAEGKPVYFTSKELSISGGKFRGRMTDRGELIETPEGLKLKGTGPESKPKTGSVPAALTKRQKKLIGDKPNPFGGK